MKFLNKFLAILILGTFTATQVGCATLRKDLPTILTYVQDGALILSTIQSYTNLFFATHPNAVLETKVDAKILEVQTALSVALHASQGATDLTEAQYTAAFAPFMNAYNDLLSLTKQLGIEASSDVSAPKATLDGLVVPTPLIVARLNK